jgi:TPR repeat protein
MNLFFHPADPSHKWKQVCMPGIRRDHFCTALVLALLGMGLTGCVSEPQALDTVSAVTEAANAPGTADGYQVVDCLLPGQIRQLGTMTTYVTQRRPARTTKDDCAIRGGEYVLTDRADYQSSLKIWLAEAEKGSAEAQYYSGTIYEKGQAGTADYRKAAGWYRKSAEQGDKRAAIALGRLYEQGLGVTKDPAEAFQWYAKATDLPQAAMLNLSMKPLTESHSLTRLKDLEQTAAAKDEEITKLHRDLARVNHEIKSVRHELDERTMESRQARLKVRQQEDQVRILEKDLTGLKAKPDAAPQVAALERQLQGMKTSMQQDQRRLAERDTEVAILQTRIVNLEKNAERIQTLEQTVARKDGEVQQLRTQLTTADLELGRLNTLVAERQRQAQEGQRQSNDTERRYLQAQAELEQLRTKPDHSAVIATYEETVKTLQQDIAKAKRESDQRQQEVAQLQQKIALLEADAAKQAQALQVASVVDLGFDGPSLDIIDPPLVKMRGIVVAQDHAVIPVATGARRSITGRVLAPAGLRSLTVNGEAVKPNDDGIFTATLPPMRSNNEEIAVQILAADMQNKRTAMKFSLKARGGATLAPSTTKQELGGFGRYHALVIGNDHYKHWPQLMNAIADASAVAKLLEANYGFRVTLLKDATRSQIMKALNQYRKMLTEKDNLLIYYAGHGHLEQGIDRGYWIPVEAEVNDNSEWLLLPGITDMLQLMSAKHILVVADSCFSGKLTRSSLAQLKPGLTEDARFDLLKTLSQKRVRTAMTSGGVKPVLDAGGSGHSVFADAFLGVLEDNMSVLEAERLFWAVRTRVVSTSQKLNAEQIPTYDPIHMAGHESLGDFIFVPQAL